MLELISVYLCVCHSRASYQNPCKNARLLKPVLQYLGLGLVGLVLMASLFFAYPEQ